jgi:AbrB family looped-hinge helix DNA binding protein
MTFQKAPTGYCQDLADPYIIGYNIQTYKRKERIVTNNISTVKKIAQDRSLTTKVTTKGQITVPKPIREHLKLTKGDRIEFLIGINGEVTIMPTTANVRKLKGMVAKPEKPVTVDDMNQAIEIEGSAE